MFFQAKSPKSKDIQFAIMCDKESVQMFICKRIEEQKMWNVCVFLLKNDRWNKNDGYSTIKMVGN